MDSVCKVGSGDGQKWEVYSSFNQNANDAKILCVSSDSAGGDEHSLFSYFCCLFVQTLPSLISGQFIVAPHLLLHILLSFLPGYRVLDWRRPFLNFSRVTHLVRASPSLPSAPHVVHIWKSLGLGGFRSHTQTEKCNKHQILTHISYPRLAMSWVTLAAIHKIYL